MNTIQQPSDSISRRTLTSRQQMKKNFEKRAKRKWLVFFPLLLLLVSYLAIIFLGSIFIDDRKLDELEKLRSNEDFVTMEQMPTYLPEAFLSIEDHRFYYHFGIDPISIARSVVVDIQTGSFAQGGSTITMQLAKNQFLTQEKSIGRKLKEVVIAINLERMYTKDELIEIYLNTIYFGHGTYGIEQAANFYFGDSFLRNTQPQEVLTLSEATTLASLPKGPEIYSPIINPQKAIDRQAIVLKRMEQLGFISPKERRTAAWKSIDELPVLQ